MGRDAAARGTRSRQHWFNGTVQQDDGAQDGRQKSAHSTAERCNAERRRLCLDHSVCQGRQRRPCQLQPELGQMVGFDGYLGREQRHLQQIGLHDPEYLRGAGYLLKVGLHDPEQLCATAPAQNRVTRRKVLARQAAEPGRPRLGLLPRGPPRITTPGLVASWIGTRTTTQPTPRPYRAIRRRYFQRSNTAAIVLHR